MLAVPVTLTRLIVKFARLFSKRMWEHLQVLMVGTLLAPGKRMVTRAHLGIETQRQWSDWAIGRTTPALSGLYSLVTLLAQTLPQAQAHVVRTVAWYAKPPPTFSDALALVRRKLWGQLSVPTLLSVA